MLRGLIVLCGLALLLWMSVEDTSVLPPVALGLSVSLLVAARQLQGRIFSGSTLLIAIVLVGAAVGLGTAFAAALLMLVKTGWHAHVFPEYPLGMIVDVLRRAPAWAVAGGLIGLGVGMVNMIRMKQ